MSDPVRNRVGSVQTLLPGADVHVGILGESVDVGYGDGATFVRLSPLAARALSRLLQTAAHESQRVRSSAPREKKR